MVTPTEYVSYFSFYNRKRKEHSKAEPKEQLLKKFYYNEQGRRGIKPTL